MHVAGWCTRQFVTDEWNAIEHDVVAAVLVNVPLNTTILCTYNTHVFRIKVLVGIN